MYTPMRGVSVKTERSGYLDVTTRLDTEQIRSRTSCHVPIDGWQLWTYRARTATVGRKPDAEAVGMGE